MTILLGINDMATAKKASKASASEGSNEGDEQKTKEVKEVKGELPKVKGSRIWQGYYRREAHDLFDRC
jgi:hypothetical protein